MGREPSAITVNTTSGYPEGAPQLGVRKLSGQFQVLEADSLSRSLIPGEQHGQLEGGDLQVILAHLVLKGDLEIHKKRYFTSFVFNKINWLLLQMIKMFLDNPIFEPIWISSSYKMRQHK